MTDVIKHSWFCPLLIAAAFVAMLAFSWGTWPDPLVDFGTQVYVPWRIVRGDVLYRDLAYYNGPLSSYFNAAAFTVLGVGMRSIWWMNIGVVTAAVALIYRLALRASGRWAATVGSLAFLIIFAFAQLTPLGNFNWMAPYTHEVTHGITLGLAVMVFLERWGRARRIRWMFASGSTLGLVFLTKAEPTAAAVTATVAYLAAAFWIDRASMKAMVRAVSILLGCSAIPPLIAAFLLRLAMPWRQAIVGTLGSWPWLFDRRVTALGFYRRVIGLDDLRGNLWILGKYCVIDAIAVLAIVLAGLVLRPKKRPVKSTVAHAEGQSNGATQTVAIVLLFLVAFAGANALFPSAWADCLRPLPVGVAICLFAVGIAVFPGRVTITRHGSESSIDTDRRPLQLALVCFALPLIAKLGLQAHVFHYGFVMALPATVLMIAVTVQEIPGWINRRGGNGRVSRALALAFWAWFASIALRIEGNYFAQRRFAILPGTADAFRVTDGGLEVQRVCDRLMADLPPGGTVVILPQGLMLNYLIRHRASTKFINLMPPEVLSAGELSILASLQQHPPDRIVVNTSVIDHSHFTLDGQDPYAGQILNWVSLHYVPEDRVNVPNPTYGLVILRPRLPGDH